MEVYPAGLVSIPGLVGHDVTWSAQPSDTGHLQMPQAEFIAVTGQVKFEGSTLDTHGRSNLLCPP